MLSVVIPAYNEEARLPATLERIRAYLDGTGEDYEVVVVDDGSADGTRGVAERAAEQWPQLRALALGANQGKGAAVRKGMLEATGDPR
ncbi:MAG: glycosyltransferase, partial [Candidatus Dormibacteria bacterium]